MNDIYINEAEAREKAYQQRNNEIEELRGKLEQAERERDELISMSCEDCVKHHNKRFLYVRGDEICCVACEKEDALEAARGMADALKKAERSLQVFCQTNREWSEDREALTAVQAALAAWREAGAEDQ